MHVTPNMYKIMTWKAHAKKIVCVTPNMYKIITVQTNAKESLLKNACDQINHLGKMSLC